MVCDRIDAQQLQDIGERYRALVESSSVPCDGTKLKLTVSVGGTMAVEGDSMTSLIDRADGLMYQSKAAGKNKATFG